MIRPLSVLVAAALTVSTFAGASAANASTPSGVPDTLTHAAGQAQANASGALGGIDLSTAVSSHPRVAAASPLHGVQSLHDTLRVKVKDKKYDIRISSVGSKADPTRIQLFIGTTSEHVSVQRLVRITVVRHGYTHPLLQSTTTFRRFVVMAVDLVGNPLMGKRAHFTNRSEFVAAFGHALGLSSAQVSHEYGAVLRFAQMSLDLSTTLLAAAEYAEQHPTATDLSAVPTVQTVKGSGGYTGTVTIGGTPTAFSVTATDTTDDSSLTEAFSAKSFTITYTVGGKTYTAGY